MIDAEVFELASGHSILWDDCRGENVQLGIFSLTDTDDEDAGR